MPIDSNVKTNFCFLRYMHLDSDAAFSRIHKMIDVRTRIGMKCVCTTDIDAVA